MSTRVPPTPVAEEETRDLGFGTVVARESRLRLLNRDGSFNVERTGLGFLASLSLYHALLTMSWRLFIGLMASAYVALNALFASAYLLCGPGALQGSSGGGSENAFLRAFFFSVQTFSTIGYGHIGPAGLAADILVTVEAFVGLLGFAISTGLVFARFSRPMANIAFSRNAIVAPYRGGTAFEFRIANLRSSQIIELEAKILFSRMEAKGGSAVRRFYELKLERNRVAFFPLSWTVVHPIDQESPMFGLSERDLVAADAEFLILLSGFDETFSQIVHTRSSYKVDEVVWNAKFGNLLTRSRGKGALRVDVGKIHDIERVQTTA